MTVHECVLHLSAHSANARGTPDLSPWWQRSQQTREAHMSPLVLCFRRPVLVTVLAFAALVLLGAQAQATTV
jgi:hypothetical protein